MTSLETLLEAFRRGALDDAAACFEPDARYAEAARAPVDGRAAIARHFAAFGAAGTRWRFVVDDVLRDGDRACVTYRFAMAEGADGPWRERAGCAIVRLGSGGLIAEWREYSG
jgi:ketosteroid isomerase-like protein